ncbi:MAG: phosphatidate cytidylyltransferase [Lentimonas sp.]|jgi:phosphatidate cytidylyltransferase
MAQDNLIKYLHKLTGFTSKIFNSLVTQTNNRFHHLAESITKRMEAKKKQTPSEIPSNFKLRLISGIVMMSVGVFAILFSKTLFFALAILITILMTYEWMEITKSVSLNRKLKWNLIGFTYILLPIFSALELRETNSIILLWMFAVVAVTDIFAYFTGKNFGGPKLMPDVSPNKTWSGLAGAVLATLVIGVLSSLMFSGGVLFFVTISVVLSLFSQAGDLLESKLKRSFEVKDSSNIIPGHGGVLDRLDGMMVVAPITLLLVWIFPLEFISR